jgi:hypothetical protein
LALPGGEVGSGPLIYNFFVNPSLMAKPAYWPLVAHGLNERE